MFAVIARAVFGTSNDRSLKSYQRRVPQINALEPARRRCPTRRCAPRPPNSANASRTARPSTSCCPKPSPWCARPPGAPSASATSTCSSSAAWCCRRQDRRDADRRGQDPGRHAARLPERARRQGRACRHRQRLPGAPRRRVDGPDLPLPRHERRRHRPRPGRRDEARAIRRRHHLRHQQRVRLRLPARQHEVPAGRHGPARASTSPSSTRWTAS